MTATFKAIYLTEQPGADAPHAEIRDVPVADLMPGDAPLRDPRAAVAAAYLRLAPAAEGWLDADLGDQAPMRPADARFARRFT